MMMKLTLVASLAGLAAAGGDHEGGGHVPDFGKLFGGGNGGGNGANIDIQNMINKELANAFDDSTCQGKLMKVNKAIMACTGQDPNKIMEKMMGGGELEVDTDNAMMNMSCIQEQQQKIGDICDGECKDDESVRDQCENRELGPPGGMGPGFGPGGVPDFMKEKSGKEMFDLFMGKGFMGGLVQDEIEGEIASLGEDADVEQWSKLMFKLKMGFNFEDEEEGTNDMFEGLGYDKDQIDVLNKCNKRMQKEAFAADGDNEEDLEQPFAFQAFSAARKLEPSELERTNAEKGFRKLCGNKINPGFMFNAARGIEAREAKKKIFDEKRDALKGVRGDLEKLDFFQGVFQDGENEEIDVTNAGMKKLFGLVGKMKLKRNADGEVQGFAPKEEQDDENVKALMDANVFTTGDIQVAQRVQTAQKLEASASEGAKMEAEVAEPAKESSAAALSAFVALIGFALL